MGAKRERYVDHAAFQREKRREIVAELYLRRLSQVQITERLRQQGFPTVVQPTVSRDIDFLRKQLDERAVASFQRRQEEELRGLEMRERHLWSLLEEAISEWHRSKIPRSEKRTGKSAKGKTEEQIIREDVASSGLLAAAASLHAQLDRIVTQRCRILGIYAPKVRLVKPDEAWARLALLLGESTASMPPVAH